MPFARARSGGQITSSGSTPSCSRRRSRRRCRRSLVLPLVEEVVPRPAHHRAGAAVQEAEPPEVEHHLGDAAGQEDADGRVVLRPVRQGVDEARHGPVHPPPVGGGRTHAARPRARPRARGSGGSSSRRTRRARASRSRARPGVRTSASVRPSRHCSCTACAVRRATSSQIGCPDGASAACGTVSPKRLRDDLSSRGGAEELAAAAGAGARAAAEVGRLLERHEPVREAGAERLHGAGVLPAARGQRDPARNHRPGQLAEGGERHRHRRQALVAGADGDHAPARRQAADEPAQHERGVVPVRERVEHPGRALRAAVARVGDVGRERQAAEPVELARRPRARAARPPSARCGSRGRSASRRPRACRPASRGSGTGRAPSSPGPSPSRRSGSARRRRPDGPVAQELRRQRQQAGRPVRRGLDVEEVALAQLYRPRSRTVSHATSISPGLASKICPVDRRT